jgi:DNA ligase 1
MLLAEIVQTSQRVALTRSRRQKIVELSNALRAAPVDEIPVVAGLLSGEPRQGRVGVGWATVAATDATPAAQPTLTITDVDSFLESVPTMTGPGSQSARRAALSNLMSAATRDEQVFLGRLLTGELRQGALEGVLVEAIAAAAEVDRVLVRRAVMLGGDLPTVAGAALSDGEQALSAIRLEVLRPIRPMLASTAANVEEAVAGLGAAVVDWKLDGARIQVHRKGDEIRIFTRNLNDITDRLPEVVEIVRSFAVHTIVLDGESLALDEDGAPRRFAETMSRVGADRVTPDVSVQPFFFDLLHLNGEDVIDLPLAERIDRLADVVPQQYRVPGVTTTDAEAAAGHMEAAIGAGHEGVLVKDATSPYEAGRRGSAWRKVKPVHTLDLVVLAAEWGHGRRTGWLSNLHLGCRDPDSDGFVMLGKTFKGLTDEMLAWQTEELLRLEERRTARTVWVRPQLVVEVALDGLVFSPRYPAGMALRFARVKGYRPDKDPADADTLDTVRSIYERSP